MAKQTTKKTPVKKITKKAPVKASAKTPVAEHKCSCGAECACHKHGSMHVVKHIIVWAIIFALGLACGKMMGCNHHGKKMMKPINPVFVNGCLDMRSIKCPKMVAAVAKADVNGDGCISEQEYKVIRAVNKKFRNASHGPKRMRR